MTTMSLQSRRMDKNIFNFSFFLGDGILFLTHLMGSSFMQKIALLSLLLLVAAGLAGCYQIHSDDDFRTVPVTNNPNIVPSRGGMPSAPI